MKLETQLLRSGVLAMLFAGVWTVGCGAESPEVPGDDDDGGTGMGGSAGTPATGGAFPSGGVSGTPATGGAFPTGGTPATGGSFPTGGTPATGGSFPTGGTPATGGAGGSGTMCGSTTAAPGDTSIDDLEDGENGIKMPRVGYWYTYNDGTTCAQMPAPDPSGASPFPPEKTIANMGPGAGNGLFDAHTSGAACATWGAGMGFDLNNCGAKSTPYNASAFNGISFWYKSSTPIRLIVSTVGIIPTTRGGTCVPGGVGMECDNGHGMELLAAPAGMVVMATFATLSQSFGQLRAFDKTQIVNIQWQVAQALPFDFTIDDIAFTP